MSASADSSSGIEVYVVSDDPYTVLKAEQALRSICAGKVAQLRPREVEEAYERLRAEVARDSPRSVVFLVPAELLTHINLHGSVVIGYGPAQALDLRIDPLCFDYVVLPWSDAELRYRVRRAGTGRSFACPDGFISWGRNWLVGERTGGPTRRAALSPTQAVLLDLLITSAGEPVSRSVLYTALGESRAIQGRAMDMRVSRLRRRIREVTVDWQSPPTITGHRGHGYQFSCQQ